MKRKNIILAVLASIMTVGLTIGSAMAYFTTYVTAKGGVPLGERTDVRIEEPRVFEWQKEIIIQAEEGNIPAYVRVKAFAPEGLTLTYNGEGWHDGGDGFYYYEKALDPGEAAKPIYVKINDIPEEVKEDDSFNVIVIYESTTAVDGAGQVDWSKVDWNRKVVVDGGIEEAGE